MFTTTGSRGLYKAPVSKSLLLVPSVLSAMLSVAPPYYQSLFLYSPQAVTRDRQLWRLFCGRLICLDLKDTFCYGLLIYNFRILERRFGSRKFASFLFGTWVLSALADFLLVGALHFLFELQVDVLPAGLLGPVFALFVPFFCSIPRVRVTQVLGQISITNKSLIYIVGLQLLTSCTFMWLIALSGLVSGVLYYRDALGVRRLLLVPRGLERLATTLLGPLLSGPEPTAEAPVGMGATLELQQQQRVEQLEQQLMLSQLAQFRSQPSPQPGLLNRLLPSLRHRGQPHPTVQPHPQQPLQPRPLDNSAALEEQVARLMEMGFSRVDAQEALRASNNDINMATNFLLQQ